MNEMHVNKHETSTTYIIDGRTFIIKAFDPMLGNFLLMQIASFVLPMGLDMLLSKQVGTEVNSIKKPDAKPIGKTEFIQFQTDILTNVYEDFGNGQKSPVVRENGTYGVADVSMMLLLKLIVASLAFNFKDFFDAIPSNEDSTEDQNMQSADTLISTLKSFFQ